MKLQFNKLKTMFQKARDFLAPARTEPPAPVVHVAPPADKRPEWMKAALARLEYRIAPGIDYEARAVAKRARRRARVWGSSS